MPLEARCRVTTTVVAIAILGLVVGCDGPAPDPVGSADAGRADSSAPIDSGRPDDSGPGRDAASVDAGSSLDAGYVGMDTGCNVSGAFTVMGVDTNPPFCILLDRGTCDLTQTSPTSVDVVCFDGEGSCTLDAACRVCSGTTLIRDTETMFSVDFPTRTLSVTFTGMPCSFTLIDR